MAQVTAPLVGETFFTPRLARLVQCLSDELDKRNGPPRCYTGLMVGTLNPLGLAKCTDGQCGVAWVRPVTAYSTDSFPALGEEGSTQRYGGPRAMEVEVGVGRCYPRIGQKDAFPDPQDHLNATQLYMADMAAAERAIMCCFPEVAGYQVALGVWSPIEPQTGWSGGIWQAWIG